MSEIKRPLRVGDAVKSYQIGTQTHNILLNENTTIVAIRKTPANTAKLHKLIHDTCKKYNAVVISAENLADNPKIAPRLKPGHLYFFQS